METNKVPYSANGPTIKHHLTQSTLSNLPMFNPLQYKAYVPRDTIFPPAPFF